MILFVCTKNKNEQTSLTLPRLLFSNGLHVHINDLCTFT